MKTRFLIPLTLLPPHTLICLEKEVICNVPKRDYPLVDFRVNESSELNHERYMTGVLVALSGSENECSEVNVLF